MKRESCILALRVRAVRSLRRRSESFSASSQSRKAQISCNEVFNHWHDQPDGILDRLTGLVGKRLGVEGKIKATRCGGGGATISRRISNQ